VSSHSTQVPVSVFERMSLAAAQHGAVNLGQGFPDFGWPEPVVEAAARFVREESNQYAPSRGLPALRKAVAAHYHRHQGTEIGPDHVVVTSGATEALAACILALVQPGDEVIVMTPAYDAYMPLIRRAGGVVREVVLRPPAWRIEADALRSAVSGRTRAIVLNNPHNPTGRLFGREELEAVAAVARENDLLVISDEVWEHVLLGAAAFTPLATLPDMAGRVLKCGSAGKIFSLTGWKIGWLVAEPELASTVARTHQYLTFATPPNLQAAVAMGLDGGDEWLPAMRQRFTRARDRAVEGLEQAGYRMLPSAATYFQCVDLPASGIALDDERFAALAVEQAGVAVIPLSPFFDEAPVRGMVRLCFAKQDETLDRGVAALARARALALGG
jgi:aspartate/methionine/tyrosine aminotransferase